MVSPTKPRINYDSDERPQIASRSNTRVASGAFTQISQSQINQIKESFTMLDSDRDGNISAADLEQMLTSLGQYPSSQTISDMMTRMPSPLQFAPYLTAMSAILCQFSSKDELVTAFSAFDDDDSGHANVQELRDALIEAGVNAADIDLCFKPYVKFSLGKEQLLYRDLVEGLIV
ncbi:hypothetical protein POJ06DRAFT_243051 [Lipomyces tetrasporus]|uniref:EF-hand domain-containing protein n=1 Tax=Lipomyces tetrasporus TaxID=54092 RepID=A0AAD7QYP0_9ASCO|nr:uncharacterized protein POJ06DRAFT_243051 [Lipomyces tetrasporus]KAJ8103880.1 hypothetical protein POJ06DRAFT_243051 [Lipomyces tetrasporus]